MEKIFKISLSENWKIQSSKNISVEEAEVSIDAEVSNEWIPTVVPSTVLGSLVANNLVKDPFFGENLKDIAKEQFEMPWWYVNNFELTTDEAGKNALVSFDGINHKANVWLNGKLIADFNEIDGAFRITAFDVSKNTVAGNNILAIEVIPPLPGDFSIGYVDWNPSPPDGNMGVFRPVTLKLNAGVGIENPFVQTKVNLVTLKEADLTISAELVNYTDRPIVGKLIGLIESVEFDQQVTIEANSKKTVEFSVKDYAQLKFNNPRLWWPIHLGDPNLYDLDLEFRINDVISDASQTRFGIREIEDYWLNEIHRGYKVNGQKVMIKGGGWTDDLFLMDNDESLEAQIKYVKQMNLNCVRLEGFWGKDHKLYDLCDEHGILLMVGWSCHWEHELHLGVPVNERFGGVYKPEHIEHISKAWEEQVIWLRNHPSIFVWTVASDKVPITALEEKYIETFSKYDPNRPYLNSTGGVGSDQHVIGSEDVISEISGSSGVKMLGPYAYTAPIYWFTDTNFGGAYGFNTETGPGAQVPQIESLKKMIPKDQLWPMGDVWDYHCGRYEFANLSRFKEAINKRYGEPDSLEDFDKKAQAMNYELMRPMFEAFQVHKKRSTGVVQWMLNAAWPKMYWQLYDYYLNPTGAFYATQKACLPLSLIYNYGDHQIYMINDYLYDVTDLKAQIRIYDIQSNLLFEKNISTNALRDSSKSIFELEELKNLTSTYFLDLRLLDTDNKEISNNFYWLSTKEETLDYEADLGDFAYHTPSKDYADLTLLNDLPEVNLDVLFSNEKLGKEQKVTVDIENNSDKIAFLINLKLVEKETGEIILPVFWEDNFISLLAGEKRTIVATFTSESTAELKVEGWNLK
jgi:exo-1,4-beta-D-glucosaminidase